MILGSCYCGNITIGIPRKPKQFTACNCSICRKYGALWCYFLKRSIQIEAKKKNSIGYGVEKNAKRMRVGFCKECGCTTHYDWGAEQKEDKMMAVNGRVFELELLETISVKKLDGARHWDYVKGPPEYPFKDNKE